MWFEWDVPEMVMTTSHFANLNMAQKQKIVNSPMKHVFLFLCLPETTVNLDDFQSCEFGTLTHPRGPAAWICEFLVNVCNGHRVKNETSSILYIPHFQTTTDDWLHGEIWWNMVKYGEIWWNIHWWLAHVWKNAAITMDDSHDHSFSRLFNGYLWLQDGSTAVISWLIIPLKYRYPLVNVYITESPLWMEKTHYLYGHVQ